MVYLWIEKVKRQNEDPLTELLRLVGSSPDKCLDKEFVAAGAEVPGANPAGDEATRAEAAAGEAASRPEQAGPSSSALPTARAKPVVEQLPCIYCSETFKV